jgi:hypothetical protein
LTIYHDLPRDARGWSFIDATDQYLAETACKGMSLRLGAFAWPTLIAGRQRMICGLLGARTMSPSGPLSKRRGTEVAPFGYTEEGRLSCAKSMTIIADT